MFEIGDYVVNASNGVCKIEDIVRLNLSSVDRKRKYYLLVPISEKSAKLYIPKDGTSHGLRLVMGYDEAQDIISRIPFIEEMDIGDEKQREQIYKEIIQGGDPEGMISIMKSMMHRKSDRLAQGKKATALDDRYYQIAAGNLIAELAFALGKEKDEVCGILDGSMDYMESLLLV